MLDVALLPGAAVGRERVVAIALALWERAVLLTLLTYETANPTMTNRLNKRMTSGKPIDRHKKY
jgi:hypothetical protein